MHNDRASATLSYVPARPTSETITFSADGRSFDAIFIAPPAWRDIAGHALAIIVLMLIGLVSAGFGIAMANERAMIACAFSCFLAITSFLFTILSVIRLVQLKRRGVPGVRMQLDDVSLTITDDARFVEPIVWQLSELADIRTVRQRTRRDGSISLILKIEGKKWRDSEKFPVRIYDPEALSRCIQMINRRMQEQQ